MNKFNSRKMFWTIGLGAVLLVSVIALLAQASVLADDSYMTTLDEIGATHAVVMAKIEFLLLIAVVMVLTYYFTRVLKWRSK